VSLAGGWCTKGVTRPYGVSLSKHIRREQGVFSSFASFEVGYGFRTRFWHDMWCGDRPMKESFFGVILSC
jgi:hypothetical protein